MEVKNFPFPCIVVVENVTGNEANSVIEGNEANPVIEGEEHEGQTCPKAKNIPQDY